jgi:hypothetical protein
MPRPLSCIPLSLTAATMLLLAATAPQAQTLLSGDHSIDGQLCVGTDCTDTEDPAPQYGIVIKQTQPGIYFEDTSTAGFPTVDWEIVTRLNADGDMTLDGTLTTGGPACDSGCDAVFDPSFERLSVTEHAALMWDKGHLPAIGPTVPGAPVNLPEKMGAILNELEHAHIYIETLHGKIERLEDETARIDAQEQVIARLTARLEALEAH